MDFFQTGAIPANQVLGTYDLQLVMLSYIAAFISSYIALEITSYLRNPTNSKLSIWVWFICGGIVMGAGIWSMHFIGMLAFSLPQMTNHYDLFWTGLSLFVAILASTFALALLKIPIVRPQRLALGGIIMGFAIASMHYTGMEAMKVSVDVHYILNIFLLSILIAIVASEAALWLALKSSQPNTQKRILLKIISALIMAAAICGMHYTGMAAAIFTPKQVNMIMTPAVNPYILAIAICCILFVILTIAVFALAYREAVKEKLQEYVETADLLRNILNSSIEYSIVAIDLNGTILSWNAGAKKIYGYEETEMVGKENIQKLSSPKERNSKHMQEFFNTARLEGQSKGIFERVRKDGTPFIASAVISIRRDLKGKPIGYLLISKDITEQRKLEEQVKINELLKEKNTQMQESDRLKSEFLANMSHELRTPLNAIIGFSELMYDEQLGSINAAQKEGLDDIITSARHLLKIINDILDMAKFESGKMSFAPQVFDLKTLINEAIASINVLCQKKRINLTTAFDESIKDVYLDPSRLKQVIYNLLSNAIKFTSDLGSIQVRVFRESPSHFRLEVEDNGIGIKPEDTDKIFNKFSQLDSSASRKYAGTGLGLSLTKEIVEAQGGKVGVISVPAKGSIFHIILPINKSKELPQPIKGESYRDLVARHKNARNVLVVEDNPDDLKVITNIFLDNNFTVKTAITSENAIMQTNNYLFDLITLDLLLPDMSGFEVLKSIRKGINKETPVIVISICPKEQQWFGFLVDDYLVKPIKKEALQSAINGVGFGPGKGRKVIVIDDDPSSLKMASQLLKKKGYNILCLANSKLALDVITKEKPDVIILDLMMPDVNGFEIMQQVISLPGAERKIPIIIWTAKELTKNENDILLQSTHAVVLKGIGESIKKVLDELERINV